MSPIAGTKRTSGKSKKGERNTVTETGKLAEPLKGKIGGTKTLRGQKQDPACRKSSKEKGGRAQKLGAKKVAVYCGGTICPKRIRAKPVGGGTSASKSQNCTKEEKMLVEKGSTDVL